jgi:hypothetical protein
MKLTSLLFICLAACAAFARGPQTAPSNLPITTDLLGADVSSTVTDIQSDTLGPYHDGVNTVTSFLTTNGYNGIIWGDWQFGTLDSTTRKVSLSFANPIQTADGGTAIPNPPFTTNNVIAHIEDKCTALSYSMILMSAGQTLPCPAVVHFFDTTGYEYRIYMAPNSTQPATPETTFVQVTCNTVAPDNTGCNDWFIDPIPGHDASGNAVPGTAIGRLVSFGCSSCPRTKISGKITDDGNRGDYKFRFHFHLTRP